MAAKMSVLGLILSFPPYLRSALGGVTLVNTVSDLLTTYHKLENTFDLNKVSIWCPSSKLQISKVDWLSDDLLRTSEDSLWTFWELRDENTANTISNRANTENKANTANTFKTAKTAAKFSFDIFRWINRHIMLKCSYAHRVQSYPVWVYAHIFIL